MGAQLSRRSKAAACFRTSFFLKSIRLRALLLLFLRVRRRTRCSSIGSDSAVAEDGEEVRVHGSGKERKRDVFLLLDVEQSAAAPTRERRESRRKNETRGARSSFFASAPHSIFPQQQGTPHLTVSPSLSFLTFSPSPWRERQRVLSRNAAQASPLARSPDRRGRGRRLRGRGRAQGRGETCRRRWREQSRFGIDDKEHPRLLRRGGAQVHEQQQQQQQRLGVGDAELLRRREAQALRLRRGDPGREGRRGDAAFGVFGFGGRDNDRGGGGGRRSRRRRRRRSSRSPRRSTAAAGEAFDLWTLQRSKRRRSEGRRSVAPGESASRRKKKKKRVPLSFEKNMNNSFQPCRFPRSSPPNPNK